MFQDGLISTFPYFIPSPVDSRRKYKRFYSCVKTRLSNNSSTVPTQWALIATKQIIVTMHKAGPPSAATNRPTPLPVSSVAPLASISFLRTTYYDNDCIDGFVELRNMAMEAFDGQGVEELGVVIVCKIFYSVNSRHVDHVIYSDKTVLAVNLDFNAHDSLRLDFHLTVPTGEPPSMSLPECDVTWEVQLVHKKPTELHDILLSRKPFQKACLYRPRAGLQPRAYASRMSSRTKSSCLDNHAERVSSAAPCTTSSTSFTALHDATFSFENFHCQVCVAKVEKGVSIGASLGCDVFDVGTPVDVALWIRNPHGICSGNPMNLIRNIKASMIQSVSVMLQDTVVSDNEEVLDTAYLAPPHSSPNLWTMDGEMSCSKCITLLPTDVMCPIKPYSQHGEVSIKQKPPAFSVKKTGVQELANGLQRRRHKNGTMVPLTVNTSSVQEVLFVPNMPNKYNHLAPTIRRTTMKGRRGSTETIVISVSYRVEIKVSFYFSQNAKLVLPFSLSSAIDTPTEHMPVSTFSYETPRADAENIDNHRASLLSNCALPAPFDQPPAYHRLAGDSASLPSPSLLPSPAGSFHSYSWFDHPLKMGVGTSSSHSVDGDPWDDLGLPPYPAFFG